MSPTAGCTGTSGTKWGTTIGRVTSKASPHLAAFRELFGDESADYGEALEAPRRGGASRGLGCDVCERAMPTMHPWEDWARCGPTACTCTTMAGDSGQRGAVSTHSRGSPMSRGEFVGIEGATQTNSGDFVYRIERWTSIADPAQSTQPSMGQPDVYPFALTPPRRCGSCSS